jgi:hypothetical protein
VGGHGGAVAGSGRQEWLRTRGMAEALLYERCRVEGGACFMAKPTQAIDAASTQASLGRCTHAGTATHGRPARRAQHVAGKDDARALRTN